MKISRIIASIGLLTAATSVSAPVIGQTILWDASDAAVTRKPTINFDSKPEFPPYPPSADAEGVEGDVVMLMCVSNGGQASDVSVEVSSGDQRLDDAAVAWVKNVDLNPALIGDHAVPVCGYRMKMEWRLDD